MQPASEPQQATAPQMTAKDVVEIVALLEAEGITVHLDGGWGVDALLEHQTRGHADLDIAIHHADTGRLRALLTARGYRDVPRDDSSDYNYLLGDSQGRLIDIHTYAFDAEGHHAYGIAYPADSLTGSGSVNGRRVQCISAEWLVKFHTGYAPDAADEADVKALCQHFNLPLPAEYGASTAGSNRQPRYNAAVE